jgi:alpha-D-glucose phosphate-specific phosphoglucomutase
MSGISFGTDGWRAVIAEDFTFANLRICSQAVADWLKEQGTAAKGQFIGYDTRFLSEEFAATVAGVYAANGIPVWLSTKPVPTPVVSYGITHLKTAGGVVITASHNPAIYNGFKYKSADGASAPTNEIEGIERHVARLVAAGVAPQSMTCAIAEKQGKLTYWDPDADFFSRMVSLVDVDGIRRSGLRIAYDAMYGAGAGYLRSLLGPKMAITEINSERNPLFPGVNPEPIARNLEGLSGLMQTGRFDVGIANDGDADRIGLMDEGGKFLNQLQVFSLLALYLLEVRGERRPIVRTVTSSSMLNRLGELYGVKVYETQVGFKYVAPVMLKVDASLGGEESGGYGFRGHVPERDGVLAALMFLDFMVKTGKKPSQLLEWLFSKVGPHYYDRNDYHTTPELKEALKNRLVCEPPARIAGRDVARVDTTDGFRFFFDDGSWLLIRFSGTEPLIRVYCETLQAQQVPVLLAAGRGLLESCSAGKA